MPPSSFTIRPCLPSDEPAAYDVCLKTGDSGRDATHLYDDPCALGHIYVGPYIQLEPGFAFVLEDPLGVCGYVLGAFDSDTFHQGYVTQWLPKLRARHPEPTNDPSTWTLTQRLYHAYYQPDIYYPDSFRAYPSHLHIDLLARAQGRGLGKAMVQVLLDRLVAKGSPGVHLAMSAANERAYRFYVKLGFQELARVGTDQPQTVYLGKRLH
jgi:GNAT superfamily N-acetyltransferase